MVQVAIAPLFGCFPVAKWFLAVYVRDVWSRLHASLTSTYGSILKIDLFKQGTAMDTANWATSIGNERGDCPLHIDYII